MLYWQEPEYRIVTTEKQLAALCEKIKEANANRKPVAIDTESTGAISSSGLDPYHDWLLGMSFSFDTDCGYYIPIRHTRNGQIAKGQLDLSIVVGYLNSVVSSDGVYIGHNIKHDYRFLWKAGINLFPAFWDTMIAKQMINGNNFKSSKLKDVINEVVELPRKVAITFEEAAQGNAAEVDPVQFVTYAANDTVFTYYLYKELKPIIDSIYPKLFYEAEMPLIPILAHTEMKGIKIDEEYYKKIRVPLVKCRDKIAKSFLDTYAINVASTKQLGGMLKSRFADLKLEVKRDTGNIITDVGTLKKMRDVFENNTEIHKIAKHVLMYRKINKALNTYIDKYPAVCHEHYIDGEIEKILHTNFRQILNTGRMSSSPNVQNITRDEALISVRKGFIARRNYKIVEIDWSGMELRIGAIVTKDDRMVTTYIDHPFDADLHTVTGQGIFSKTILTTHERYIGKKINFTIFYGATKYRVSQELGCSLEKAEEYIDRFFETYPGILNWKKTVRDLISKNGYSETLYGRRRYLSPNMSAGMRESWKYDGAIRELTNHIIQGTSADILKLSKVKIAKELSRQKMYDTYFITSTHDSIVLESKEPERAAAIAKDIMEITIDGILLPVDIEIKDNFSKG